jgi:hypothetical protein
MSQKNNKLELYVADKLNALGIEARPTRASGASTELGDVFNEVFLVECKQHLTQENVIVVRKVWNKLCGELPAGSQRIPIHALENKYNERFIAMQAEDFFRLIAPLYKKG